MSLQNLNYDALAREVARSLRGRRSQAALNRRLGYRFNQVAKWESGRKRLLWSDFVALCRCAKIPIDEIVRQILFVDTKADDAGALITALTAGADLEKLLKSQKISKSTITRWQRGHASLTAAQFLRLVDGTRSAAFRLVESIVPLEKLSCVSHSALHMQRVRKLYYDTPDVVRLLCLLDTTSGLRLQARDTAKVSGLLGLSQSKCREHIRKLMQNGLVVESADGFLVAVNDQPIDMRSDQLAINGLRSHWLHHALTYLGTMPPNDPAKFTYQIASVSEACYKAICSRSSAFYYEIWNLIENDRQEKTTAALIQTQILPCIHPLSATHR